MIRVKVVFGSDIRRWRYPETKRYKSLLQFITKTFKLPNESCFYLQWEDDENDRVTLASESDLKEAFACVAQEERKSVKIYVIHGNIRQAHKQATVMQSVKTEKNSVKNEKVRDEGEEEKEEEEQKEDTQENPCVEWRRLVLDFLQNEKIAGLLPAFVRALLAELRKEEKKRKEEKDYKPKSIEEIFKVVLKDEKFVPIVAHELYEKKISCMLRCLGERIEQYRPVLMSFNEDAIASWVPHLIKILIRAVANFEKVDLEVEMDPMCHAFFPTWFAFMNANGDCMDEDSDGKEVIHRNVACDECNASPIKGARFKCCVCSNYDLCSHCESFGNHSQRHPMVKLNRPIGSSALPPYHGLHELMRTFNGGPPRWFGFPHGPGHFGGRRGGGCRRQFRQFHPFHQMREQSEGGCKQWRRHWQQFGQSMNNDKKKGKKDGRLMAEFVKDITLPDRSYYPIDTVLTKTWRMKNSGERTWENVQLVFFKGNESLTLEKRFDVVAAKPGDTIDVSAAIRTPMKPGRYCSYYRLQGEDGFFGPRVWVDIFACDEPDEIGKDKKARKVFEKKANLEKRIEKQEKQSEKLERKQLKMEQKKEQLEKKQRFEKVEKQQNKLEKLEKKQEKLQAKIEKNKEKLEQVQKKPNKPNKEEFEVIDIEIDLKKESVDKEEEKDDVKEAEKKPVKKAGKKAQVFELHCVCGAPLISTTPLEAYYRQANVHCDICGKFCASNSLIYHCPADRTKEHREGYDLCPSCVSFQMKTFDNQEKKVKQDKSKVKPKEIKDEKPKVQVKPEKKVEKKEKKPVEKPVEKPKEKKDDFPYYNELLAIQSMGFQTDVEHIKFLLVKNKGQIDAVVSQILPQ